MGLIGCGGRGNWIGAFFPEYTGARIVAVADVIREHLDATQASFKVDASRAYYGPDAYRELVASKLDAVIDRDAAVFSSRAGARRGRRRQARIPAPSR